MTSQHVHNNSSGKQLNLPEPDPDNITVLTRNLPNKPILPWNRYDSPWRDPEVEQADESEVLDTDEVSDTDDIAEQVMADTLEELADDVEDKAGETQFLEVVTECIEKSQTRELDEECGETEALEKVESVEVEPEAPDINPEAEFDEVENVDGEDSLVAHLSEKLGIGDREDDEEDAEELPEDEEHEEHELKQLG
ncbi:hypothetical protein [Coleofasciculus sp.]|uniref:hypothetical protein n=1 Tax=Coleofasciculus sp. TaxID=3100458 RepID=UPI0039F95A3B